MDLYYLVAGMACVLALLLLRESAEREALRFTLISAVFVPVALIIALVFVRVSAHLLFDPDRFWSSPIAIFDLSPVVSQSKRKILVHGIAFGLTAGIYVWFAIVLLRDTITSFQKSIPRLLRRRTKTSKG